MGRSITSELVSLCVFDSDCLINALALQWKDGMDSESGEINLKIPHFLFSALTVVSYITNSILDPFGEPVGWACRSVSPVGPVIGGGFSLRCLACSWSFMVPVMDYPSTYLVVTTRW